MLQGKSWQASATNVGIGTGLNLALTGAQRFIFTPVLNGVRSANLTMEEVREGVVYLRTDAAGGLKPYVGQSQSWERYLARQREHAADFPDSFFQFKVLGRADPGTALDVAEETWIRQLGRPTNKSSPGGLLSNKRYQMNDVRYRAAGGTVDRP
ncbi:MAG TPA: hypothetical protein VHP11_01075 [Tepidisphaeraceae bacterium]|nr:hypothetical protein [Tepidisphaeraceae bacterium]